jgi:hypothetical protein
MNDKMFEFEKDDDLHIRFTVCASNLRSYCFDIPPVTEYNGKSEVGRIIPAICSSNSMVAALEIIELVKYLYKEYAFHKNIPLADYGHPLANRELYVQGSGLERVKPSIPIDRNPNCTSCNLKNILCFEGDLEVVTLSSLINEIQKLHPTEEFSVFLGSELIFEKAEYLEDDELEAFVTKAEKPCKAYATGNQIKIIFEPEGCAPQTVYALHVPAASQSFEDKKQKLTLKWSIGPCCGVTPLEQFMRESNKKIAKQYVPKKADKIIPEAEDLESISESNDIEEIGGERSQQKSGTDQATAAQEENGVSPSKKIRSLDIEADDDDVAEEQE